MRSLEEERIVGMGVRFAFTNIVWEIAVIGETVLTAIVGDIVGGNVAGGANARNAWYAVLCKIPAKVN